MKSKHSSTPSDTPNPFLTQHKADVIGVLSGLDRLRFKGSLPPLYYPRTMDAYLEVKKILFKDFKQFATDLTQRIKNAADRKSTRLNSSHTVISYAVFCLKKK